jgi:hypothetical protein
MALELEALLGFGVAQGGLEPRRAGFDRAGS